MADEQREGGRFSVTLEEDGATILVDGEVFTRYLKRSGTRPVLWPIIGPTGSAMTRAYPVAASEAPEETDHVHHRSLWFGYEGVNGCDFWHEPEAGVTRPFEIGSVVHREFVRADSGGRVATVATRNDWNNASGQTVCHDERILQFGADRDTRWIDFRIKLWSANGPLVIGDSKEGCFALRVPSTMRVDEKQGGRIINSAGQEDAEAWGQPAEWVDYSGPVDGEIVGITIMSHPDSFQSKPRWHVRTYGLFGANPFGKAAFEGEGTEPARVELPEGERLFLRYRVTFHRGHGRSQAVGNRFKRFADSK
ncbi:MAG TPA: PmoA family protein [Lacipirellula sp.]